MPAPSFDAKQILNATMGALGAPHGTPWGFAGEWAQFSPKKYFDTGDYYNVGDHFDAEAFFSSKTIMRDFMDNANAAS